MPRKELAPAVLARFLRKQVMDNLRAGHRPLNLEDRIDQLSQWALVLLLLTTLGGVLV